MTNTGSALFEEIVGGWVRSSRAMQKEFDAAEYHGADTDTETVRCESCYQPTPVDGVVRTLDGPICIPCMKTYVSEAEILGDLSFIPQVAA